MVSRKKIMVIALAVAVIMSVAGCGEATDSNYTSEYTVDDYDSSHDSYDASGFDTSDNSYAEESEALGDAVTEGDSAELAEESGDTTNETEALVEDEDTTTERKVIYTSNISIETKKFDQDLDAIKELISSNDGFYESSSLYGSETGEARSATFVARIPSANYSAFMDSVGDIGSVTYKNENADDITSSYVDVATRINTLQVKLDRLTELEKNAETVEELLQIEDRINEVTYEIESYKAQLRTFDDQVEYCTISIDLTEVIEYSEVRPETTMTRFQKAFVNSISGFLLVLQNIVILIIYMLPYLIVIGLIVLIILLATRKSRKARKANPMPPVPPMTNMPMNNTVEKQDEFDEK